MIKVFPWCWTKIRSMLRGDMTEEDPEAGELRGWSPERRQQDAARRAEAEAFLQAKEELVEHQVEQQVPQPRLRRQRPQASSRAAALSRPRLHTRHGIFARAVGAAVAQPVQRRPGSVGDASLHVRHSSHNEKKQHAVMVMKNGRRVRRIRKRRRARGDVDIGEQNRKQAVAATLRLLDTSKDKKRCLREDAELTEATAAFDEGSDHSFSPQALAFLDEQLSSFAAIQAISSESESEGLPADSMALPVEACETSPALSDVQEEAAGSKSLEAGSGGLQDACFVCKADREDLVEAGLRLARAFSQF